MLYPAAVITKHFSIICHQLLFLSMGGGGGKADTYIPWIFEKKK
jgi:hypothetical protein